MEESNHVRALEKIFTEVDESQIKIIFSNQCIKAQAFLVDKLKKQTKQQKQICNFISSGNINLEAEIKFAEEEIKNLIIAHDTIKSANVELRKEWLLKKSENLEITGRIEIGENKYEQLWLSSKSRYESIPYVQKCLQGINRRQSIQNNINSLQIEAVGLINEMKVKKYTLLNKDQKQIIDLAKFLLSDKPKIIKEINDKINEIEELTSVNMLEEQEALTRSFSKVRSAKEIQESPHTEKIVQHKKQLDDNWPSLSKNENNAIVMPSLQLLGVDLDILSVKLDQIKRIDLLNTEQPKETMTDIEKIKNNCGNMSDECTSSYFNNKRIAEDHKNKSYSDRKLINILDDVKLERNHIFNIISKVELNKLHNVNLIRSEMTEEPMEICNKTENVVSQHLEVKEVEVNCSKNSGDIFVPPTQFLDESKNSQEKEKGSFDISMEVTPMELNEVNIDQYNKNIEDSKCDETLKSQEDVSSVNEEDYGKIKDKILRKHNLDSSPQFVYAKHSILHKMNEYKVTTSKCFDDPKSSEVPRQSVISEEENISDKNKKHTNIKENLSTQQKVTIKNDYIDINIDVIKISSPKNSHNIQKIDLPTTGFLFNHGSQGIPDSLNLSESTTGFEECDGDFPHCIDSSVLLSPKADLPMEVVDDNVEVPSQEMPNFISGARKTGFSFFGWSQTESKPDSNIQNAEGSFNFNFSGEEKKNRGGLFSMFR